MPFNSVFDVVSCCDSTATIGSQIVMLVPNGGDTEFGWGLGWSILGNLYVLAAAAGILGLAARELRLVRRSPQVVTV